VSAIAAHFLGARQRVFQGPKSFREELRKVTGKKSAFIDDGISGSV
jgi:hypothetical protein